MNEAEIQRQKEIKEAEELLFTGPQALGFAKGLFLGRFVADWAMPYPRSPAAQQAELDNPSSKCANFWINISIRWRSIARRTSRNMWSTGWRVWACSG